MDGQNIPEIRIFSPLQTASDERTCAESHAQVFDMRSVNLTNFPLTSSAFRLHHRSHNNLITRAKSNVTIDPIRSLNLLRQTVQKSVNQELDQVIRKYLNTFFRPAIRNIRSNAGEAAISEHHIHAVCRQVLDEAKKMYFSTSLTQCGSSNQSASPAMPLSELSDSESLTLCKKRVRDDGDSDESDTDLTENMVKVRRAVKKSRRKLVIDSCGKVCPKSRPSAGTCDRNGFRWDPERLTEATKFVLGSRANKALGFGLTRGRLYTKHAELFRYIGDTEDKQWLSERGLMPASGGRAYLLMMQDIDDLLQSSDYSGVAGVDASEMGSGFTVPKKMIEKMKKLMAERTERRSGPSVQSLSNPGSNGLTAGEDQEPDSRPESSVGKREDGDEGDGRSLTGDEISNILLNSADVPSSVPSPDTSSKPFSPNADDSPLVMDSFL